MPEAFDKCVREKGRVRTITLKGGRFMRICFKDGKSHPSEVQTKQEKK